MTEHAVVRQHDSREFARGYDLESLRRVAKAKTEQDGGGKYGTYIVAEQYRITIASDLTAERRTYTIDAAESKHAIGKAKVRYYDDTGYAGHAVAYARVR